MAKLLDSFTTGIKDFLNFLFLHFSSLYKELLKAKNGISARHLLGDFFSVLKSVGMITFFNFVALIVFTLLPQGKDVLLIIVEDIILLKKIGNLMWLLVGVLFWSIASEYGTRYSIYVTDISGKSLSDPRVEWRKAVQKAVSEIYLMLPYLIVFIGFTINYFQDTSLTENQKRWGFGIPMVCLYLLFSTVVKFYFKSEKRHQSRKNLNFIQRFGILPRSELEWCTKLIGIYNKYVFILRKPSNFTNEIKGPYKNFCENFLDKSEKERNGFPQDPSMIDEKSRVPEAFKFDEFTDDKEHSKQENPAGSYKWVYTIPLKFYKTLHKELLAIVGCSAFLITIISILPIQSYASIGAPGLVVIAFGCWIGLYLGLLFMDYAYLRDSRISLRFILFLLLIFSSIYNDDHPVRYNKAGSATYDMRPDSRKHFLKWFDKYVRDSLNTLYQLRSDSFALPFYPVVFVCAEGGALRTGAFTAQTLSFLQDSILKHYKVDVRNSVYAYSGVSGGSVGISFFNAIAYLSRKEDLKQDASYSELTKLFFNQDFLAPVIGKMFYGDFINLFLPFHIPKFDRAIALELAWEQGYEKVIRKDARNIFSSDCRSLWYDSAQNYPAIFINTEEIESGLQCWLSNVKTNPDNLVFADKRDLLSYKVRGGINYSTMTNFSSRFPLFSPGAMVEQDAGKKFHYVDGGYVENTGAGTMLELLRSLEPVMDSLAGKSKIVDSLYFRRPLVIKPFVLVLQYDQYNQGPPANINFANEFSEVLYGIYNTRSGRSLTALEELKRFTHKLGGEIFILPLQKTGSEVPLNWVLSNKSLDIIEDDIKKKWDQRDRGLLRRFFAIDTTTYEVRSRRRIVR